MARNMDKDNDDLLDALESIKDLLEKGESKLTAARESLARAKPSGPKPRFPVSDEPVVPVLDDVVSPAIEDDAEMLFDDDIPELDAVAEPVPPPPPPGYSTDEVLAMIDTLHDTLARELHDSLINAVVRIEADLKVSLDEQIRQLKKQLEQDRKD